VFREPIRRRRFSGTVWTVDAHGAGNKRLAIATRPVPRRESPGSM
jgi:hypothetical protein